ncbi:arylesterase [Oceanobacter mangrovi]|uniref:arylesterase n=1 Tax=Oceanobacter mangrovi TaxID=2862510 RepID=UPI001FE7D89D|nr:arylesterase [Oceanobacter mangrovi]
MPLFFSITRLKNRRIFQILAPTLQPGRLMHAVLLTAVLLLTGCSEPALPKLTATDRILAFGDSLTEGKGVHPSSSYPAVLQHIIDIPVAGEGVSGETTAEGLLRLPETLDRWQPKLVILMEGGNDILRNYPVSETRANLAQMIEIIQARDIPVVLLGIPRKRLLSDSAPFYKELAEQYELVLEEDLVAGLIRSPSMKSDAVHFNEAGYQKLAEGIAELLRDNGAL